MASERRSAAWAAAVVAGATGCVGAPGAPAPGRGTLWGVVTLVPPAGVVVAPPGAAYGDRRTAHAERVDYSHPGFVVVFTDGMPPAPGRTTVALVAGRDGVRFAPAESAVPLGGTVALRNDDDRPHVISSPRAELLSSVAAGETVELVASEPGEWSFHALDAGEVSAVVFVAPGPHTTVARSGRWALPDLPPGTVTLRAWHPRFPAVGRAVEVRPDTVTRVDLTMGAGQPEEIPRR